MMAVCVQKSKPGMVRNCATSVAAAAPLDWRPGSHTTRTAIGSADQLRRLRMRRRDFIAGLSSAAAWPLAAQAQSGTIAVEEATVANLQAVYMAGRATVRAVVQAHLD